jgi:catechol 2,3-dioxygenase-like lactoylglutathione lyase family enzyme
MSIRNIAVVSIPVSDADRALAFYRDKLGFEVRHDNPFGKDQRWIELVPPGAQSSIVLVTWFDKMPPGSVQGLVFDGGTDIEATHAELRSRGVEIGPLQTMPWGCNATFRDPDGNGLVLSQAKPNTQ